jgi:recombination protein RecT
MSNPGTALVRTDVRQFGEALRKAEPLMAALSPNMDIQRYMRIVYQCVTRTPKLMNCTTQSVIRSVVQAAEIGLEAGGARGEAYLVPFKDECTLIVGYRGWVNLFYRSGAASKVVARCVYEGDEYEEQFGTEEYIRHRPCGNTDPAQIVRAYAIVWLTSGQTVAYSMTTDQIERHRKRSRAANEGPWVTDRAAMFAKTALLGLKAWVPNDERIGKALSAEVIADTGDLTTIGEFETVEAAAVDAGPETGQDAPDPNARLRRKLDTGQSPHAAACKRFFARVGRIPDAERYALAAKVLGKSVTSFNDLSPDEIDTVTDSVEDTPTLDEPPQAPDPNDPFEDV